MAGGEGEGVTNLQLNALVGEFGDTDLRALQVTQQGNKTAMLGSNIAHQLGTSLVLVGGAVGEIQTGNVQASQNQLFENFRRVTGRAKGSDAVGATDGHAKHTSGRAEGRGRGCQYV